MIIPLNLVYFFWFVPLMFWAVITLILIVWEIVEFVKGKVKGK
jgi:hypothetical protein